MKTHKKLTARFFETPAGTKPVLVWIKAFADAEDRKIIGRAIQKVEVGGPEIGKPTVDGIGGGSGLYEIRCIVSNGSIEARIIFAVVGSHLLLLHGFVKKTNAISKKERDIAKHRLAEAKRTKQP